MSKTVADAKVRLTLEDKITAPIKRIQKRLTHLSNTLRVPRLMAATRKMTASLKGVNNALGTVTNRVSMLSGALGLAGGGLAASLTAVTMKTMHMGDSLHHASRHLGMSVKDLQLWGDAADNSGYSAEKFQQSLAVLNRRSAQTLAGQRRGIMEFQALGISVKDASGKLKSNSDLLEEITDKMSKIDNQAQRQHIAALLFGGDGKEMAAMLSQGMEPIKELFEKAKKSGWLMGADVAHYAADLSDKLGAFKKKLGGVATFIGAHFMPVINDMIDAFSKLIDENRDLIQTTVANWAKIVRKAIQDLCDPTSELRQNITNVTESIKGWFKWLEPLTGEISLFKIALAALVSFIVGPLIAAIASLTVAFFTFGTAVMTTPIGWIAAAIIGLIAAGVALYVYWDKIKKWFSALLDGISDAFYKFGAIIILLPGGWIIGLIAGIYKLYKHWETVKAWFISALNKICDAFVKLGDFIMKYTLIGYIVNGIKKLVATAVWLYENWDEVMASCGRLWDSLGETINQFFEWFSNLNLSEAGSNLIMGLWDGIKSKWNAMAQWLHGAVQKLMSWMPDFVKDKLGFNVTVSKSTTESLKNLTQETTTYAQKIIHSTVVPNIPPEQRDYRNGEYVNDGGKQPSVVVFQAPEPIMPYKEHNNKPTNIDASITISGLNINGGNGSPQEISAAIKKALADQARQQRLAINSSFSD
ncbi:TP901 family phage tail tape measure protein [Bartonella chomelii]|uniref:TP901 family phage tail tape measure protein n=1 Tax=Bartonella chomelii TaxID=236402 RepID=A0ABR6E604_9HYPH|nr:phage tail tape measure protein [Bartonella chomelii]MBA9083085.1 TP901 family phage tail tape measure protein [Bartonella chomelii]